MSVPDEFVERFGQLDIGPRHPQNPDDPSVAFYDVHSRARRYTFDSEPGNAWAVDTRTGERAFRIDGKGRTFLPSGQEIATPRLIERKQASGPAQRLYSKPAGQAAKRPTLPAAVDQSARRLAAALYPAKPAPKRAAK